MGDLLSTAHRVDSPSNSVLLNCMYIRLIASQRKDLRVNRMSNIFSLLNPVLSSRAPIPSAHSASPASPASPTDPPSLATPPVYTPSAAESPTTPLTATASLHGLWNSTRPATDPVLALYTRRLTSQTEALYSLLQKSLSEIKDKQESLGKLLAAGESSLNVLEGKVREVVGTVGGEG